jgi:hypothetical protein
MTFGATVTVPELVTFHRNTQLRELIEELAPEFFARISEGNQQD